jgi:hypothetical protein
MLSTAGVMSRDLLETSRAVEVILGRGVGRRQKFRLFVNLLSALRERGEKMPPFQLFLYSGRRNPRKVATPLRLVEFHRRNVMNVSTDIAVGAGPTVAPFG